MVDHVAQTYPSITTLLRLVHNFKSFFLLIGVSPMSCFGHQLRFKHKVLFLAIVHKNIEDADVDKAYINQIYAHCKIDCICETSKQITTRIVSSFVDVILFLLLLRTIMCILYSVQDAFYAPKETQSIDVSIPAITSYKMSSNP